MKKMFKLVAVLLAVLLCATGCVKMDLGVEVKEDGTASLTAKMSIDEETYTSLKAMDDMEVEGAEVVEPEEPADSTELELDDFKKETIDGEVYYSVEKTMEFESYEELAAALTEMGEEEASNVFEEVTITSDDQGNYDFSFVTAALYPEASEGEDNPYADWVNITLTVKMPGKVSAEDTNGELLEDGSVRFVLDDFSESQTYSVHSNKWVVPKAGLIIMGCAAVGIVVGVIITVINRKKLAKYDTPDEDEEEIY